MIGDRFWSCPDWHIYESLEFYESQKRIDANTAAYTEAIGWCGLFAAFAGKNSKKAKIKDFLPFPDELGNDSDDHQVSKETLLILRKLIKENKIQPKVLGALSPLLNDMKKLLG